MNNDLASILFRLRELTTTERAARMRRVKLKDNEAPKPEIRRLITNAINGGYDGNEQIKSLAGKYLGA